MSATLKQFRIWQRESRLTLRLALPIVGGMVSQMLMGLTDTIMVGQVGVIPLAASSVVNAVAHLPMVFGFGLLSAIAVMTAQAYGARNFTGTGEVLRHGFFTSTGLGLAAAAGLAAAVPLLDWLGQDPAVIAEARPYWILFAISAAPALIAHGGKQFSEAVKHPWAPTCIMLGAVLLNVLLNWIFIFGHWGAPALGLRGAGVATVIARIAMAAAMWLYILRSPALSIYRQARWRSKLNWQTIRSLLRLGTPVGLQHLLEVGAFAFAALMMGWIGADAIAAHQIAITCAATTFMLALGTGMAVCIRVGHAWGGRQFARVRRIGWSGVALGAGSMGVFALLFLFEGSFIASLFVKSPPVIRLAAQLLVIAAVFQIADGIQVVAISALRGLGDMRMPAAFAALAYWVIALPVGASLAFVGGLQAVGIWIGLATGLIAAAAGLSARFLILTRQESISRRSLVGLTQVGGIDVH